MFLFVFCYFVLIRPGADAIKHYRTYLGGQTVSETVKSFIFYTTPMF